MEIQVNSNKVTWVIKNFTSLVPDIIFSDPFVIGGCKWYLSVYPKGKFSKDYLSLFLHVDESETLPSGWRRQAKYSFMIVNQIAERFSQVLEERDWFSGKAKEGWGFNSVISLEKLKAKDSGFLVNGELKIVVEIEVLEVVGPLDVQKESSSVQEGIDVNGFHVLPSQVESVRRIFDKHPDIALRFRAKNQLLRTACMNFLLSIIGTLRQSVQELLFDDLVDAESALTYVKESGFKVDWLEKKLQQVKEKKMEEQIGETRVQELEEELKACKQKWSDIEAQLEKEKAKVLAARAHLTWDDFV